MKTSAYGPERLHRLQRIFDAVWHDLKQRKSPHTFPWAVETTRFRIARLVLDHGGNFENMDRIKRRVLQSLERVKVRRAVR